MVQNEEKKKGIYGKSGDNAIHHQSAHAQRLVF